MIIKQFIRVICFCLVINSFAQNLLTKHGLKTGRWVEKDTTDSWDTRIGNYKLISQDTYIITDTLAEWWYIIKYPGLQNVPGLHTDGIQNGLMSVRDGVWQVSDSTERLIEWQIWKEGIHIGSAQIDSARDTTSAYYYDLQQGVHYEYEYREGQLYKKTSKSLVDEKRSEANEFYPNHNLIVSNAEPKLNVLLGSNKSATFSLGLSCKNGLQIVSIASASGKVIIKLVNKSFPISMLPGENTTVLLSFTPDMETFPMDGKDTLLVQTAENNQTVIYKIYCDLFATHVWLHNLSHLKKLTVSQSNDKYLFVSPMGTITSAYLEGNNKAESQSVSFGDGEFIKFDLHKFPPGRYRLHIMSCNDDGKLWVRIKK
ncbi:hypothetical protein QNI16_11370 [Cytophagaceae bacterium YF14B1]|uniref:T9SS C-terminal target domain-containing protein n=1 Tax=Xanthocytophaga flava TaxID=3048013 RepID=A0AAE3QPC3_9BACT|nr:hypothetical protein [Xanthocytophaga flavus]MDJ1481085.1 hypothetical protein [Xanthocytophaga flavus]